MKVIFISFLLLFPLYSYSLVDMRNANFADPWVDMEVAGSGYDMSIRRTYNSRTLYNGIFGFGWCSSFETKLKPKTDGTLVVTECGAGDEVTFYPKNFKTNDIKQVVASIITKMKKSGKRFSAKYYNDLSDQLYNDPKKREELALKHGVANKIADGTVFKANLKSVDSILYKKGQYIRTLADTTTEVFDASGKIVRKNDKNGNYLVFSYGKDGNLSKLKDNNARQLNFTFNKSDKVERIVGPNGLIATYKYKNQDLVYALNGWKNKYTYAYDNLHNLTQINYPDKTTKKITYDKNKDWVTSFKHRDGCVEDYSYTPSKKNPKRHYWSTLKKTCKGKVINKSKYEFVFKPSKTGQGDYLAKVKSNVNGKETEVQYHAIHEKPIYVKENNVVTRYAYYSNGLVKIKKVGKIRTDFKYLARCKKVSHVKTGKRITEYSYDNSCNLDKAKSNTGMVVQLGYDRSGRIVSLKDQAKRVVTIDYDPKFGKPNLLKHPGIGALKVKYKDNGEIDKVDSSDGPAVAVQVARAFNNLVELIRPAGVEIGI